MKKPIQLILILLAIAFSSLIKAQNNIVFILDGSGSMWQKIDGEFKIAVAKTVMKGLVEKLPDSTRASLVAYGHNRKSDCEDIETLVPFAPLDKTAMSESLDGINPVGMTPIAKSIQHVLDFLKNENEEVTIVLVSDGLETCDGNACELLRQAKAQGAKITMHVVGFGIEEKDLSALECIAQAGNGQYLPANNAGELANALDKTIEPPVEGDSYLSVKATLKGELVDAIVKVYPKGETKEIIAGRTYSASTTNPRLFLLPAGDYEMEVTAITLDGSPQQKFTDLKLMPNDTLTKEVDFSNGTIKIMVTRNGELSDATVKVMKAGLQKEVAASRSYRHAKSNPVIFDILPGTYDIEIKGIEIKGAPIVRFENQVVANGDQLNLEHNFLSGELKVGAKLKSNLVDAVVKVLRKDNDKEVARGRTYMSDHSNPKSFILEPGIYQVEIQPVKPKGLSVKTIEVEIQAGKTLEKWGKWK